MRVLRPVAAALLRRPPRPHGLLARRRHPRHPGHARRRAPPPGARAARGDLPAQGQLGVPLRPPRGHRRGRHRHAQRHAGRHRRAAIRGAPRCVRRERCAPSRHGRLRHRAGALQSRGAHRRVGGGELAGCALRGAPAAGDLRDEWNAPGGALLRRAARRGRLRRSRLRRRRLRPGRSHGRHPRAGARAPESALRGAGAEGPGRRRGPGDRSRARADRQGVRGRAGSGRGADLRRGGRRPRRGHDRPDHLRAPGPRLRRALRGLRGPRVRSGTARLLLPARAREAHLPLEHPGLPGRRRGSPRERLRGPGGGRRPPLRRLLPRARERSLLRAGDPRAGVDLTDLVPARGDLPTAPAPGPGRHGRPRPAPPLPAPRAPRGGSGDPPDPGRRHASRASRRRPIRTRLRSRTTSPPTRSASAARRATASAMST